LAGETLIAPATSRISAAERYQLTTDIVAGDEDFRTGGSADSAAD
jgi:hypothetical protein